MSVWDLNSTYLNLPVWHIYSFSCSQKGKGLGMQKAATMWETTWTSITSCTYTDMKVIASGEQTCNLIQRREKNHAKISVIIVSMSHFKIKFTTLLGSYLNKNNPMKCVAILSYLTERCPSFGHLPGSANIKQGSWPSQACSSLPAFHPPQQGLHHAAEPQAEHEDSTAKWGHTNKSKETVKVPCDSSQGSCYQVQGINYLNFSGCTLDSLRVL